MNQKQTVDHCDLQLGDLSDVGEELSTEELSAISGAMRMEPSWTCGTPERTDEWVRR